MSDPPSATLLYVELIPADPGQISALFRAAQDLFPEIGIRYGLAFEFVVGRGVRIIPRPDIEPTGKVTLALVNLGITILNHGKIEGSVELLQDDPCRPQLLEK